MQVYKVYAMLSAVKNFFLFCSILINQAKSSSLSRAYPMQNR